MENCTNSSYSKYDELSTEVKTIKDELEQCKNLFIELENRISRSEISGNDAKCINDGDDEEVKGDGDCNGDDKMGIKTSSSDVFTLSQLETELKQFYEFCKQNDLTDKEIANICKPLMSPMRTFYKSFRFWAVLLAVIVAFLLLKYSETVQWHCSALGRMLLIELLPLWNWKSLHTEKCLINYNDTDVHETQPSDCTFCEYIQTIDVMNVSEPETIYRKYIINDKPVILDKGVEYWTDPVDFGVLLETILKDDVLSKSVPCNFKSNLHHGSRSLYQFLKEVKTDDVFFAHFQNCAFDAVKAFRKYFKRPKFLAAEIRPVQYSWLLMSNRYKVEKYKQVQLKDEISIVGQVLGKTDIMLHPNGCSDDCESLRIELALGEVLIFTDVWTMEYNPDPEGLNLAVILETH